MRRRAINLLFVSFLTVACTTPAQDAAAQEAEWIVPALHGRYVWNSEWRSPLPGTGVITFEAKTSENLHICFASEPSDSAGMYELIVGGWNNNRTALRKGHDGQEVLRLERRDAPRAMVLAKQWTSYWMWVDQGRIRFGRGLTPGEDVLLDWSDPEPNPEVRWFGFSGWAERISFRNLQMATVASRNN